MNSTPDPENPVFKHHSKFLHGNYTPTFLENDESQLKVEGDISGLTGLYCRNGPNPHFEPPGGHHWFDGDGMIHAVQFHKDGTVSYRNKWIRTECFKYEEKLGRGYFMGINDMGSLKGILWHIFEYARGLFGGVSASASNKVASNTSLIYHDRRLMALVENALPHWIQAQTLDSNGEYDYNGQLTGSFTAHPKIDPITGEMLTFGYSFSDEYCVRYFRVLADGTKQPNVSIPLHNNRKVMMHDMAFTKDYAIFLDFPLVFDLSALVKGGSPLEFDGSLPARIGVMPKDASDASAVRWFDIQSCFAFHVANSWQDGDIVTVIAMPNKNFRLSQLSSSVKKTLDYATRLYQWNLNMKTGKVEEFPLGNNAGEFPVCDEKNRWGYKTRYLFYAAFKKDSFTGGFQRLIKHDLIGNKETVFELPKHCTADEFVFVNQNKVQYKGDYDPSKDKESPDDNGVLMGFVYNVQTNLSELLVVNTSTMTQQARVELKHRVPHGFHGKWLTQHELDNERQLNDEK